MTDNQRPALTTGLAYKDPVAALKWLEKAFGFEIAMIVEASDGTIGHSEMRAGGGLVYIGREWDERHRSPASMGGVNTQSVHIQLGSGLDEHCERARAAGAVILREPASQFYGDRSYMAADPEGHIWTFGQTEEVMSFAEMARRGGVSVRDHL
jgi:uncharacterized glyoxalase superfamily protein PhnB